MNQPRSSCYRETLAEEMSLMTSNYAEGFFDRGISDNEDVDMAVPRSPAVGDADVEMAGPWSPAAHDDDPLPPSDTPDEGQRVQSPGIGRFVETYEGCAEAFPGRQTFMDQFRNDQYSEERRENIYFPWASKQEWDFASWLLQSHLSMAAIDSLLSLEIMSSVISACPNSHRWADKKCSTILPFRKRA